jgi:GTP-sensing pleiotropic transcriptional regulator CodY
MQYELLTQKLNKMNKEKILLEALNTFGNFTSVEQEFNANQLEAIYEAMNQVLHIAPVVGRSEQLFAFIKAIKEEFKDENWDYLDFIADRVIGKQ